MSDSEHGPRIGELTEARGDGAYLAVAIAREDARARAAHRAGPPESAGFVRTEDRHVLPEVHADTSGMTALDAAYTREEARARAAHRAGPPEGAIVRK